MVEHHLKLLKQIRSSAGARQTHGIAEKHLVRFLESDPRLGKVIEEAVEEQKQLSAILGDLMKLPEEELCRVLQEKLLNFYTRESINPYVPLAALGPWIVTTHGAVIHDSGGYGMLGLGHGHQNVLNAMNHPYVMANVMTPSLTHKRFTDRITKELGHTRRSGCPFSRFVCLNSGSESVTFTCRVTDINSRRMTEPGARHEGKQVIRLAAIDSFHGRTEGPAQLSHSSRKAYSSNLASYTAPDNLRFIKYNDKNALKKAFEAAEWNNQFIEAFFVEPVMGEGVPGLPLDREFYDLARKLTAENGSLLVVDSIQAALRAHGCLSIIDYPGFENCDPPDMETYSKALNAGQFPLSVVALLEPVAAKYITGLYGNTMTTNPRAMEVACVVLDGITPAVRSNIRERGKEFIEKFNALSKEFPGAIDRVVGTGLMFCAILSDRFKVLGKGGFEEFLRLNGIEMIHGGDKGLRFTPTFDITSAEIEMIVDIVRTGFQKLA